MGSRKDFSLDREIMESIEEDNDRNKAIGVLASSEGWEALKDFLAMQQAEMIGALCNAPPNDVGTIAKYQERIRAVDWLISVVEDRKQEQEVS